MSRRSVIVLGAGIIGSFAAVELVRRGHAVTIIGGDETEAVATRRSFAWVNASFADVPEHYRRLRLDALRRWREIAASTQWGPHVRFSGVLSWESGSSSVQPVQGAPTSAVIAQQHQRLLALGDRVELVSRSRALELEPALAPAVLPDDGILWAPEEGWVDTIGLLQELRGRFESLGGTIVSGLASRLLAEHGRVLGVETVDGHRRLADAVIVAAGAGTRRLLAHVGCAIPDDSNAGILLIVDGLPQLRRVLRTPWYSIRPHTDGRPELRGRAAIHDTGIEAGVRHDRADPDPELVTDLLARVAEAFPDGAPRLLRIDAGLRPIPGGDQLSVAGPVPEVAGLHVAYTHSGVTLGPLLGELVAAGIDEESGALGRLAPFSPARFAALR